MRQDKAQLVVNGHPLSKSCNAVLGHLMASLRANWETALYCVVTLEKDMPFPADDALYRAVSQYADSPAKYRTLHQVLPGSGTGDIRGMRGHLDIIQNETGHAYELTFQLPEQ